MVKEVEEVEEVAVVEVEMVEDDPTVSPWPGTLSEPLLRWRETAVAAVEH